MATNLTDALDFIIKEELAQGIRETRVKLDAVWEDIITSSFGVQSSGLGRNWLYKRPYTRGLAGSYQFETSTVLEGEDATTRFGEAGHTQLMTAGNGWQGRYENTLPAFYDVEVKLKEARGDLRVPIKWMQLDQFDSTVGSAVGQLFKAAAFKAALRHAMAMYTTDHTKFPVVTNLQNSAISGNSGFVTGDTAGTIIIDNSDAAKPHGRINMLHEGDILDVYTAAAGAKVSTTNYVVVTNVNYLANSFKLTPVVAATGAAAANFGMTLDAGSQLCPRHSTTAATAWAGQQPSGFNSWHVSSGTVNPFTVNGSALTVTANPEWSSLIQTVSGPLTERILTQYIGRFMERLGSLYDLDTIITPAGVVHAYLENEDNLSSYERNGRRLDVKGGWASIDYAYHGKPFRWAISNFIEPNACYITKIKNNLRELVPPSLPGTGSHSSFDNEFKFLAPLGGLKGPFMFDPGSALDDTLRAPYYRICEVFPENQTPGIILRGLDETI